MFALTLDLPLQVHQAPVGLRAPPSQTVIASPKSRY
jgi:hypothetical protein